MRRSTPPSISRFQRWYYLQHSRLYISCTLFVVSTNIATRIITPPLYRLVELTICRVYYQAHDPSVIGRTGDVLEEYCKLEIVQEKLAYLMGILETIKTICVILVTITFGLLSDKYGRKFILTLNIIATIFVFWMDHDCRILLQCNKSRIRDLVRFQVIIGGGDSVAFASLFTVVADVVPDETQRTTIFAHLNGANYITMLLSSSAASGAMMVNLWLSMWLGIFSFFVNFLAIYLLPTTVEGAGRKANSAANNEVATLLPRTNVSLTDEEADLESEETVVFKSHYTSVLIQVEHQIKTAMRSFMELLSSPINFKLCLAIFLVTALGKESMEILLLYVSKRYYLTIAKAYTYLYLQ